MEAILVRDKETKHSIRFQGETEETSHINVYLRKTEVEALGSPERLQMTLTPIK